MTNNEEMERKLYRHKRRVRNQIISYVVLLILLIGLIIGGIIGIRKLISVINDKKQAEELQKQLEELSETEGEQPTVEAPMESTEPEEEVDWLEEIVTPYIAEMTPESKVAALFMITPESLTGTATVVRAGDTTKEKLNEYPVGGLVYFSHNIEDEAQLREMLQNIKNWKSPIFLGVDEEGGAVSRVAESGLAENVGSMAEVGAAGEAAVREAGSTIGSYLAGYGFNVDFAPVADVVAEGNTTIGDRSFGADTNTTASLTAAFVEGLQGNGVSACLKHFPGLGDVGEDMHDGKASTEKTLENFTERDFPVYQAGIAAGADFVMVSHLSVPNITGDDTPSSLSEKMVTEILRGQLGYQGIVITDAMDMKAITDNYESGEAAVKALQAGVDMILMPDDFQVAYDGVMEAINNGTLTMERIDESLQRIFRVKLRDRLE